MKKLYFFALIAFSLANAQTPEILYYKFESNTTDVPNLASNPPAGTQTAQIVGNLTLGNNTACLGKGLVGTSSTGNSNYLDTKWNLSLSGSWTMHLKLNNYTHDTSTVYYLVGDALTGGNSFRMFLNGAPGANGIRLTANGMSNVDVPNVFPSSTPVDLIFIYDSSAQNIKAYVNGVLKTTVTQTAPLNFNGALFRVGGYGSSITGLKTGMIIDEFGLFNRAITGAEIQSLSDYCALLSTVEAHKNSDHKIVVKGDELFLDKGNFGTYSIYDSSGRIVLSGEEKSSLINISKLQKGVYIIKYADTATRFRY